MNSFEVASQELRPVVGNHSRFGRRMLLFGVLQNHFDLSFLHRLPQIPMQDRTTVTLQNAAQVIKCIGI